MEYFISDFHFHDFNILKYERLNFETVEEHDDTIMSILEKASQDDTIYFLGDFGYPQEDIKNRLLKVKATLIMIKGNHDNKSCEYYQNTYGFERVYNHPLWLTKRIVLSHEPIPVENGVINIHGHLHGSYIDKPNYLNANVHMLDYKLLSLKSVMNLVGKLEKPTYKFLEEWYSGQQVMSAEQREFRTDILCDSDGVMVGFTDEGLQYRNTAQRKEINYKNVLFRNVLLDGKKYTIISFRDKDVELFDLDTGDTKFVPFSAITELEGYGRRNFCGR